MTYDGTEGDGSQGLVRHGDEVEDKGDQKDGAREENCCHEHGHLPVLTCGHATKFTVSTAAQCVL